MKKTLFLRRLSAVMGAVVCTLSANAMTQHPDVDVATYCDFGQNRGRYSVHELNALQRKLREQAGGVQLHYTGGQSPYTLQQEMISFESQGDNGAFAAIAPNVIATVSHNGVQNPTFTARYLGDAASLHYNGIEFRSSAGNVFRLASSTDYKVTRLNKIITDITPSPVVPGAGLASVNSSLAYRSGAGEMAAVNRENGERSVIAEPYTYITGGISILLTEADANWVPAAEQAGDDSCGAVSGEDWSPKGVSPLSPLPYAGGPGDSGSPVWCWSPERKRYEFVACLQGIDAAGMVFYTAAPAWSVQAPERFTKSVALSEGENAALLPVVNDTKRELRDEENKDAVAHPYEGTVEVGGQERARFVGVKSGTEYWKYFNDSDGNPAWFAYDPAKRVNEKVSTADLFLTENLRFTGQGNHSIAVAETVDLGIGYVQLQGNAVYTIEGEGMLNTAGYIVDAGTTLCIALRSSEARQREWRKVGEGTLCITGNGENAVNLMLGGPGETRLQRRGGYAARNIHAASGAKVVLDGRNQVQGNVVLGFGGATLELNGHSIEIGRDFTLTAQTQDATVANSKGSATFALPIDKLEAMGYGDKQVVAESDEIILKPDKKKEKEGAAAAPESAPTPALRPAEQVEHPFFASFTDAPAAPLQVVFREDRDPMTCKQEPKRIVLSPTHTSLTQRGSGMVVVGAVVELRGLPTVHGMGSADGRSAARLERTNDWHYADAQTPVLIGGHGRFTLGSHARLTGDVTVKSGCSFTLESPVNAAQEYIEGGSELQDTAAVAEFAGLKGNVVMEEDADMVVDGAMAGAFAYAGAINGPEATLNIRAHGTVCLSNPDSYLGKVWVSCDRLENTPLHAKEVEIIAEKPASAEWREEEGKKILAVCCGNMQGGSIKAELLGITFSDIEGVEDADFLEISPGENATPVQLAEVQEIEVTWGSSRNALGVAAGQIVQRGGRSIIRVPVKQEK